MVSDLLDEACIEAGTLKLDPKVQDVRSLVREVVEVYASSTSHAFALHVCDEELVSRCDGLRVAQVLHNLISNAVKYSAPTSSVGIDVTRTTNGSARIAVTDHGIGIAPEERARLFEPFHRTSRAREHTAGIGLGLSVAKRIIEGHGGHIEVESEVGRGSTFAVVLPTGSTAQPGSGL